MNRPEEPYDVLVVGGGLAGLTAAHRAALRGLSVASMDEGGHMGGLVANVGKIDGYPAANPVSGVELAAAELEALLELGADIIAEAARGLTTDGDIKVVTAESGAYRARTLVLASGARLKSLGVSGEQALLGRGVSQCADCDAGFFSNQHVVVVGGGDAALQEALHLSDYASTVTLVTRGNRFRARQSYIARAEANPKFTFRRSTNVLEILGRDSVEGIRLAPAGGGEPEVLNCSGVFVFIGVEPNGNYLPADIERDAGGYLITDADYQTSIPGIYAVGALRAGYSGQLASAVDEATSAIARMPTRP
jgi:thioredoxin reductase (NADPH)